MTNDPVRVKWTLGIGLSQATRSGVFEIDREEWGGLTKPEREHYLNDCYQQEIANYLDGGWVLLNADLDDPIVES